ncbi:hypothetical protein AVEN_244775-1 [Araneus ventricosus]|uniref:Uncharacterized protein n=1 Tax=Araneus ventricosus TaxID=182803 RepID=A0A4Y2X7W9_ARAVE|nr:hypothetical protein AVEN_244775-1 [Araneus ventricosus]
MPGKKPRFFDILGDAKEFVIYHTWPDKYLWQMNFFDVLRRRTEEYRKQQLFCLWITYMPFVVIVKAEAVKVTGETICWDLSPNNVGAFLGLVRDGLVLRYQVAGLKQYSPEDPLSMWTWCTPNLMSCAKHPWRGLY